MSTKHEIVYKLNNDLFNDIHVHGGKRAQFVLQYKTVYSIKYS